MDDPREDATFNITSEEDGEVVFNEKVKKDEEKEDRDPAENDAKVQEYINEKVQKIDKGIEVTKANVINEQINIDVSTDYDEDIQDDEDRRAITYTGF